MTARHVQLRVEGVVQGVGFRPFIYGLATRHGLRGYVLNDSRGVLAEIEGNPDEVEAFLAAVRRETPPAAHIDRIQLQDGMATAGFPDFRIRHSEDDVDSYVVLSTDLATCRDCLQEVTDPSQRRYRYPFTNCTNCGPRFTIIRQVPYDRPHTSMSRFQMCADCLAEYTNPSDRRFHAQPIACPQCGPQLTLLEHGSVVATQDDALRHAGRMLRDGRILAVKGLGGYHLVCDATRADVVKLLRQRKYRADRPFALMARDLDDVRRFCEVDAAEARALSSASNPIVLLRRRQDCTLPDCLAPRVRELGFMLPPTPLHHMLARQGPSPLVLTSGNHSEEPLAYRDDEAQHRLAPMVDGFLYHNRDIEMRCDDSVVRVWRGHEYPLRISRGYAPSALPVAGLSRNLLACGAMLKNTFCLTQRESAIVSPHIGDLENLETLRYYETAIQHFQRVYRIAPEAVAHDLHPEYLSTKYALAHYPDLPKVAVQHHHAHVAACMADNGTTEPVLGVAMDGLGWGTDGTLWGGEFLACGLGGFERLAHLATVPMPGGEAAVRAPWRMALSHLWACGGDSMVESFLELPQARTLTRWPLLRQMLSRDLNSPRTSSMGRLFDAVSSIVTGCHEVTYEGQAAMELQSLVGESADDGYRFEWTDGSPLRIEPAPVLRALLADCRAGVSAARLAARFHLAVADMIERVARLVRARCGLERVVLSGGVFQNVTLLEETYRRLTSAGFTVLTHRRVPANDAGVSLGQAVVAHAQLDGKAGW